MPQLQKIQSKKWRFAGARAPTIIAFLDKSYDVQISPGTIYSLLYKMEKKGNIKQLPHKTKKLYTVTDSGKKILEDFQREKNKVRYFITDLINKLTEEYIEWKIKFILKSGGLQRKLKTSFAKAYSLIEQALIDTFGKAKDKAKFST